MTLVLKHDLDIMVTYKHTINDINKLNGYGLETLQNSCFLCVCMCVCDLEFDLMTLILKSDLDIMMTYFYTKNEVNRSFDSKVMAWTDTDRRIKHLLTRSRGR